MTVLESIGRDLYLAARPQFTLFITVLFSFAVIYAAVRVFGRDLRDFVVGIITEMNGVATRKKHPGSANFIIAVLIFLIFVLCEISNTISGLFSRTNGPDWVMYLVFAVILGMFFLLSMVATSFHRD